MKKDSFKMLFLLMILVMFIGAMNKYLTFFTIIFVSFCAILIATNNSNQKSYVCYGIILLLCFQNLCIGLGAHISGNNDSSIKFMTQIPFIFLFFNWVILQVNKLKVGKIQLTKDFIWFILYLVCIIYSFFLYHTNLMVILVNLRNMTVFYMAYEVGKNYICTKEDLENFYKKYMKIIKFIFFIGIILMIFGSKLYFFIGIREVYFAKGVTLINSSLPGRFYTKLFYTLLPRMGSIYYEPVNLAYLFALGFILSLFYKIDGKIRYNNVILNLIGLILTVGKGGYFVVGLTIGLFILNKFITFLFVKVFYKRIRTLFTLILLILLLLEFVNIYTSNFHGVSVQPHITSISKTLKSISTKPLGHGLGTGGNFAASNTNTNESALEMGSESGMMAFTYQYGIQGLVCLIMCFLNLFGVYNKKNNLILVTYFIPYALLITSLFQENTFTPQCIVVFMLFIGGMKKVYGDM